MLTSGRGPKLIVFGQRRSGTTITFECFRRCPDLVCFYEPLHPRLIRHADWQGEVRIEQDARDLWREYRRLGDRLADIYAPLGAPVYPIAQELDADAWTNRHGRYLAALLDTARAALIQPVRVNHHLARVQEACPDGRFVWILRSAEGVVSSILRRHPRMLDANGARPDRQPGRWARLLRFLRRRRSSTRPPRAGWRQGQAAEWIVEHRAWAAGLRADPLFVKLVALWYDHLLAVTAARRRISAARFAVLRYEDLCRDPDGLMKELCRWACLDPPSESLRSLVSRKGAAPFRAGDPRWRAAHARVQHACRRAGLEPCVPDTHVPRP